MPHLKLPAYGKPLLACRRAGDHPLSVALIFGHQWRAEVGEMPILAIHPEDYAPGVFDFHVVAGLRVEVHDQEMWAAERNENVLPPTFGVFYDLLTELARFAAPLAVVWPAKSGWDSIEAGELAREARWFDRAAHQLQWPRWWSEALHADYQLRWTEWMTYWAITHGILDRERAEAT